jgi:hypothetical protein
MEKKEERAQTEKRGKEEPLRSERVGAEIGKSKGNEGLKANHFRPRRLTSDPP